MSTSSHDADDTTNTTSSSSKDSTNPQKPSSRPRRRNMLADLQAEVERMNALNKVDSHAEHTMMASHNTSRIRRGVVETEDGRFVTDTRDFVNNEGTVDDPNTSNSNKTSSSSDTGNATDQDATDSSTKQVTTKKTEMIESLTTSVVPVDALSYISTSLDDGEIRLSKKSRQGSGPLANRTVGEERQVLLHEKKVSKIQHDAPHIGDPTGQFSTDVPNAAAVFQISQEISKSKDKADKNAVKKRSRNINTTTGVNFANEEFNRRLDRDYKRASANIRTALERGTAE